MRRVSIYCDNTYYYIAFSNILKKKIFVTFTDKIHSKTNFDKTECVILILSNSNITKCIDLYFKSIIRYDEMKVIISGSKNLVQLFNAMAGREFSSIENTVSIVELTNYLRRVFSSSLMYEGMSQVDIITKNEYDVICMLSLGISVTEIAAIKNKSVKTISHHKCSFFRKLGLKNTKANLLKVTHNRKIYFDN